MTNWYLMDAAHGGNDGNAGNSPTSPFLTFAQAKTFLSWGDTLFVNGAFTTGFNMTNLHGANVGASGFNFGPGVITIKRYGPGTATITNAETSWGGNPGSPGSSFIVFDDIDCTYNVAVQANPLAGSNCHHIRITNCDVSGGVSCIQFSLFSGTFDWIDIVGNIIHDSVGIPATPPESTASHGIYLSGSHTQSYGNDGSLRNVWIHGNRMYGHDSNNASYCVHMNSGSEHDNSLSGVTINANWLYNSSCGVILGGSQVAGSQILHSNLIYDNSQRAVEIWETHTVGVQIIAHNVICGSITAIDVGGLGAAYGVIVKNNIIADCTYGFYIWHSPTSHNANSVAADDNCFFDLGAILTVDGAAGTSSTNTNTRTADPQFLDYAGKDFHLDPGSPEIGACTGLSVAQEDFEGNFRAVGAACTSGPYEALGVTPPSGGGYRAMFTVDHTKVANTNQTNFPVLVSVTNMVLRHTTNGGSVISSAGHDIVFYSDAALTSMLDFEIERWDGTSGELVAWVRIPTLSTSVDTVFYAKIGDAAITTSQQDINGTWESNFKLVWHLPDGTDVSALDSTVNGNDGTLVSFPLGVAGQMGGGVHVGGDAIQFGGITISSPSTISFWLFPLQAETLDDYGTICGKADGSQGVYYRGASSLIDFAAPTDRHNTTPLELGVGTYVVITYSGSTITFYINGIADGTGTESSVSFDPVFFGNDSASDTFYGNMDEYRIAYVARSADWILTEYNNQSSPSTFMSASFTPFAAATPAVAPMLKTTTFGGDLLRGVLN